MKQDEETPEQEIAKWYSIVQETDECLIAIQDRRSIPTKALKALPPWRARMLADVAERAGVKLEHGTAQQIKDEALRVGGSGRLGDWWKS